jgi:hypothetical protein
MLANVASISHCIPFAEAFGLGGRFMNIYFPLIIPFDGVLSLQGFSLYPKCTFGDISLLIKITAESLVMAQVPPSISIVRETRLHHSTINGVHYEQRYLEIANFVSAEGLQKRNMYYQLGNTIDLIARVNWTVDANDRVDSVTYTRSAVQFGSTTISARQINAHIHGYQVTPRLKDFLRVYFAENIFVVPGEIVRHYSFPNTPSEGGIDTQVNITMTHVTEAIVLFPHSSHDITTFLNPKYKDLSLKFLDMNWPDTPINTTTESFFRSQLQAKQLDVLLQCSDEFENSYMVNVSGRLSERYYTPTDITNFAFSIPIEIPSTNALFAEGANSTQNAIIALTGNAIIQGEEECYHNVSETNVELVNKTPPILCLVSNTF